MSTRHYILYDEPALTDTDDASVVEAGIYSREAARESAKEHGWAIVCYSYKEAENSAELIDERFEFHYLPPKP